MDEYKAVSTTSPINAIALTSNKIAPNKINVYVVYMANISLRFAPKALNTAASLRLSAIRRAIVNESKIKDKKSADILRFIAEGAMLSNYSFNKYKSDNDLEIPLESIDFFTSGKEDPLIIKDLEIFAENTMLCRDLVNDTTDAVNPVSFADLARRLFSFPRS